MALAPSQSALTSYDQLVAALAHFADREDLNSYWPNYIVLFETWANRTLRVRQMETSAPITMAAGVGQLPADYLQWRAVLWQGSEAFPLEFADRNWLQWQYPSAPQGQPGYFTIEGKTLSVMPTDDNTLLLKYYQKIPALSPDNQDTQWLFNEHPDLYVAGALVEAMTVIQDGERLGVWSQKRNGIATDIIQLAQKGKSPGAIRLKDVVTP